MKVLPIKENRNIQKFQKIDCMDKLTGDKNIFEYFRIFFCVSSAAMKWSLADWPIQSHGDGFIWLNGSFCHRYRCKYIVNLKICHV